MTGIRTTGNSRPHIVHHGYQHSSRHSSRWERPKGELSILAGTALIAFPIIVAALLIAAFNIGG